MLGGDEKMNYNPSYRDFLRADVQPSYTDSLQHRGVKGMKWGYNDGKANGNRTAEEKEERIRRIRDMLNQRRSKMGDPRQTSSVPDDGRRVKNFKDLWYDSNSYVKEGGHKVRKDETGEAYTNFAGKTFRGKDAKNVANKANRYSNRIRRQSGDLR